MNNPTSTYGDPKGTALLGNWAAALITIAILAAIDFWSGYELSFFVFYFGPIAFAAWRLRKTGGLIVGFISAIVWAAIDFAAGHKYSVPEIAVWNTIIRLIAFLSIGYTVARLRELLDQQQNATQKLEKTIAELKVLEGLVPICTSCKKIRDDKEEWQRLETYISQHSHARFTHSLCPDCARRYLEQAGLSGQP